MLTNRERGNRVIVGGSSPHIHKLPKDFLKTGKVIGINRWFRYAPCDYWIAADTGIVWRDFASEIQALTCPKFMRARNMDDPLERAVPGNAADYWWNPDEDLDTEIPLEWDGVLKYRSTTAMAAISLAIIMGAQQIILWGVDLINPERFDGSRMSTDQDFWRVHVDSVNAVLAKFQQHAAIFKTNRRSPLNVPYFEPLSVYEQA